MATILAALLLVTGCAVDSGFDSGYDGRADRSSAKGDEVAAAVVGAVLGAAVVAAASDHHKHKHHRDHEGYRPDRDFRRQWGRSYNPRSGITCFPGQRACYKNGRGYSAKWSRREFGV